MAAIEISTPKGEYQCRWCGMRSITDRTDVGSVFCRHTGTVHEFRFRPIEILLDGFGDYATARFNRGLAERMANAVDPMKFAGITVSTSTSVPDNTIVLIPKA